MGWVPIFKWVMYPGTESPRLLVAIVESFDQNGPVRDEGWEWEWDKSLEQLRELGWELRNFPKIIIFGRAMPENRRKVP